MGNIDIESYIGRRKQNNQGRWMTITNKKNNNDIEVTFDSGFIVEHTQLRDWNLGTIRDPFYKSYCNVGYMGMKVYYNQAKEYKKPLETWHSMLKRCYNPKCKRHAWYEDCIVAEAWHNFSNFLKWYNNNWYELPNELGRLELDKDFKCPHSRIYSSETCMFVPRRINSFLKHRRTTASDYPIGITKDRFGRYQVRTSISKDDTIIGRYSTYEEAVNVLLDTKHNELQKMVEEYKLYLPSDVYKVLICYDIHSLLCSQ